MIKRNIVNKILLKMLKLEIAWYKNILILFCATLQKTQFNTSHLWCRTNPNRIATKTVWHCTNKPSKKTTQVTKSWRVLTSDGPSIHVIRRLKPWTKLLRVWNRLRVYVFSLQFPTITGGYINVYGLFTREASRRQPTMCIKTASGKLPMRLNEGTKLPRKV